MRKSYFTVLLSLSVAAGSLSSCSRANYAFNPATPAYLGSARAATVAASEPELTASSEAATPAKISSPARAAVASLAYSRRATVAHAAARPQVAAPVAASVVTPPAAVHATLTKADRKELKQRRWSNSG